MQVARIRNHGLYRWRLNVQRNGYRKRLFFKSLDEALDFAEATGGEVKVFDGGASGQSVRAPSRHLGFEMDHY